jgi:hypothetical protein
LEVAISSAGFEDESLALAEAALDLQVRARHEMPICISEDRQRHLSDYGHNEALLPRFVLLQPDALPAGSSSRLDRENTATLM